ncbi:hypothetical protein [Pseudoxanthomonas sp. X-1]|uniref:hypothetical protein n=1 Tax=Pseudoxanthomonas sp. X-1 TaxID=2571115 RepID=UPI00110A98F3|nr:hypothetical protein [Pseudoxanthomonas sp. X-1]TMN25552.1 hypothetical protein FF950_01830 [Pseudoxanthomonas sp. X-1]UAY76245.1 hypothetical protein LAJ50_08450 [Pseudoxanthomonas sp. X-1]
MKTRTVLLLAGAVAALFTAALALAQSAAPQVEGKPASAAKSEDTRSEAEKRAARRAANEARMKGQDQHAPAPSEEEEEEARKH